MKILVLSALLLVALLQIDARAISSESTDLLDYLLEMHDIGVMCGKELGAEKLKNLPQPTVLIQYPEDNDSVSAIFGCGFKKLGIVNENSEVDEKGLEKYLFRVSTAVGKTSSQDREVIAQITKTCKNVRGDDYGQTAVKVQNCFVKHGFELKFRK